MRRAFTMLELIFVIVIIGILAKFGVEFLIQAYNAYIFSSVQNKLQTQTEVALEQITNRLQYRIKSSIISRYDSNGSYKALANADGNENILEWIGYDIDGMRGTTAPTWSGFIDLKSSSSTNLFTPSSNTTDINNTLSALSNGAAGIVQSAIYFIGGNSDINKFGWDGVAIDNNSSSIHPIQFGTDTAHIAPKTDLTGQDAYEFYQLAWSAYALVWNGKNQSHNIGYTTFLDNNDGNLFSKVLPSGIQSGSGNGTWKQLSSTTYAVTIDNIAVNFTYDASNGSFTCNPSDATSGAICKRLTN